MLHQQNSQPSSPWPTSNSHIPPSRSIQGLLESHWDQELAPAYCTNRAPLNSLDPTQQHLSHPAHHQFSRVSSPVPMPTVCMSGIIFSLLLTTNPALFNSKSTVKDFPPPHTHTQGMGQDKRVTSSLSSILTTGKRRERPYESIRRYT